MLKKAVFLLISLIISAASAAAVQQAEIWSIAYSPDGKQIVSGGSGGTMRFWDANAQQTNVFSEDAGQVYSVAYCPRGNWIVSGARNRSLKLWHAKTGRQVRIFSGHTDNVISVTFSPNGRFVLSGSYDNTIRLWDRITAREIRTFSGHTKGVVSVAFSPDGSRIVSGSIDRTVKVWDTATGREIHNIELSGNVICAAFSPDGKMVAAGDGRHIRFLDAVTFQEIRSFLGYDSGSTPFVFSPDGRQIILGRIDGTLKLWDVETGREIHTFYRHGARVLAVAFSPDGKHIVSGAGDDRPIRLWDAATGQEIRHSAVSVPAPTVPIQPGLVRIEGGTFSMGSPLNEPGRFNHEGPTRRVTLRSFYIGKYPVTQREYEAIMGKHHSNFNNPDFPVEMVSWLDAIDYCNERSRREGLTPVYTFISEGDRRRVTWNQRANGYRLPTEAEWEYACRAGTATPHNTGGEFNDDIGWYLANSGNTTRPVGQKPPNAWGLFDTHGNVWEWCWDFYDRYPSNGRSETNPTGPASGSSRSIRGGSWRDPEVNLRSASRVTVRYGPRADNVGFRVARNE